MDGMDELCGMNGIDWICGMGGRDVIDEMCVMDGMNGMDWICGMGGRDGIDEMCVMDGMNGMDGRCTTFTPPNNRLVITLYTHKIPSVPLGRHQFRWDSLNNLYKFRRLFSPKAWNGCDG